MFTCLTVALLQLSGCSSDAIVAPASDAETLGLVPAAAVVAATTVSDLAVSATTDSSVTLSWTEVDDGQGRPANYRVKYAAGSISWGTATVGCQSTIYGVRIGATATCTLQGLSAGTAYEFQLMSFRLRHGVWQGAVYSNVTGATTTVPGPQDAEPVNDLAIASRTDSTLVLRWTEVDDGTGAPSKYRLKYAAPPIDWSTATVGCDPTIDGTSVGSEMSCAIVGLQSATTYDVQVMSYRTVNGVWEGAVASNVASGETLAQPAPAGGVATTVQDLSVTGSTESALTVRWTQVDDGAGQPAMYRLKYAVPPISWSTATVGCDPTLVGQLIGAEMSCTIDGLAPGTTYDLQLMSYRIVSGAWEDAEYSNVTQATTSAGTSVSGPTMPALGIWIGPAELAALPDFGAAWSNLLGEASGSCGSVDLADQEQSTNVCVLAKALVFARTGTPSYRSDVVSAIRQIANGSTYTGRALALGRELGTYVIAADLIDLPSYDGSLDGAFRTKLRELMHTYTSGAATSLVDCHERRPNNWGTMCGGTRAAIAAYLGDANELARVARVFKGYLGDRSSYAGFSYGDLSWQCDASRPVGINPTGCLRDGHELDGVLPDDQRRAGTYVWPAPRENYVWEAMQGILMQAVILERAGYAAFEWEDRAILRAAQWLHGQASFPAEGDDTWQPHVLNHYYGTSFPAPVPARPGKNMGWTDWTHGR